MYHEPALLQETIEGLSIKPDGTYVDVTFGGGGHSGAILSRLGKQGKLFAFDQDEDALVNCPEDKRFTFVRSNFRYLSNFLRYHGVAKVDGILADLGVSSHHLDEAERGFSFRFDGQLDMRMNKQSELTAAKILNNYEEEDLAGLFFLYGELRNARRIAKTIVTARREKAFERISDFVEVLKPFFGKEKQKQGMARVFQALRIEVNHEMDALKALLKQSVEVLNPGGRLAIISYHSLEDRMVKNFIRSGNIEGKLEKDFFGRVSTALKAVNNKVITPRAEEVEANPRSRSAKLRIAEKV